VTHDLRPVFGARVRAFRNALGLTQEQLAERADMHWTFISGVERGMRDQRVTTVGRLARALGVAPDELFRAEASPPQARRRRRSSS
jgi:transcriptional regulator with XRE-family HTH domain